MGERIAQARQQAGLTQEQLAVKLATTQRMVTYWERSAISLRADQLATLAELLGVTTDYLLGREQPKKRGPGPVGKMRQLFVAASNLPRDQQQKVVALLEAFVEKHAKAS